MTKALYVPKGKRWHAYVLAAAAVTMAGLLRLLLQPALGHQYEFTTLLLAVVWAAWYGGLGPGLCALILVCVVAAGIHGFRNESVLPETPSDAVGFLLYLIMGLSVAVLGETQRRAIFSLALESARRELVIKDLAEEVDRREEAEAELRKSQDLLVKLNTSLEERVRERTSELAIALQELESFTYSIAHDMRAPLRAINTTCKLLDHEMNGTVGQAGRELLGSALRAAEFMNRFVDGLLEYAHLARAPLRRSQLDLTGLVEGICGDFVVMDSSVEFEIDPGMAVVCDRTLVACLFWELIDNAVKFKKPNGACKVRVQMWRQDNAAVITVRDDGIGFERQYASRIFEPFQKLHGVGKYPGTGIGLAKSKRIVERLGGTIRADSQIGNGCSIFITFPRSQIDKE